MHASKEAYTARVTSAAWKNAPQNNKENKT